MKQRSDLSNHIFHWCKSINNDHYEALQTLLSILLDESILGNSKNIIKGHKVICFTESPWRFVFEHNHGNYMPFGISIHKKDAFDFGARPVIYQPKDECKYLHEDVQWRHVSYDPRINYCDFTWEREWRIKASNFPLYLGEVSILVPDNQWKEILLDEYKEHQQYENYASEMMMGAGCGVLPERPPYIIKTLDSF